MIPPLLAGVFPDQYRQVHLLVATNEMDMIDAGIPQYQ